MWHTRDRVGHTSGINAFIYRFRYFVRKRLFLYCFPEQKKRRWNIQNTYVGRPFCFIVIVPPSRLKRIKVAIIWIINTVFRLQHGGVTFRQPTHLSSSRTMFSQWRRRAALVSLRYSFIFPRKTYFLEALTGGFFFFRNRSVGNARISMVRRLVETIIFFFSKFPRRFPLMT